MALVTIAGCGWMSRRETGEVEGEIMVSAGTRPSVETELVGRLRAGDGSAFDQLVRDHGERLLNTARRLLPCEADAHDAVQDTFLAAFRAIGTFSGEAKVSTWLHRIAVNVCLMKLRGQGRRREDLLDDVLPDFDDSGAWTAAPNAWHTAVEGEVHGAELRAIVRDCCGRLPESYRTVLMLRLVEELDTDEVAQRLGISANAVKIRLHRARQALAAMLRNAVGEPRTGSDAAPLLDATVDACDHPRADASDCA